MCSREYCLICFRLCVIVTYAEQITCIFSSVFLWLVWFKGHKMNLWTAPNLAFSWAWFNVLALRHGDFCRLYLLIPFLVTVSHFKVTEMSEMWRRVMFFCFKWDRVLKCHLSENVLFLFIQICWWSLCKCGCAISLQCSGIGASFCYMLSYMVGRRLVMKYFPDRVAGWQQQVSQLNEWMEIYILWRIKTSMQNLACSQHQIHTQCIHVSFHKLKVPKDIHTINLQTAPTHHSHLSFFFARTPLCLYTQLETRTKQK